MDGHEELVKRLRAEFEREPLVDLHKSEIQIGFEGDTLVLSGDINSIAAKRVACSIASTVSPRFEDRLRLRRVEDRDDGAIKDAIALAFRGESTFHRCQIELYWHTQHELLVEQQEENPCYLEMRVEQGVVRVEGVVYSLSHKRLAEALLWWSPGVRDVVNGIEVVPPERDTDDEFTDAVSIVLEKDPLVHAGQIHVGTTEGVVTLDGLVGEEQERTMAENDVWYLSGVRRVVNRIEVRHGI